MIKPNWYYKDRQERSKWISERFVKEIKLSKNILDVGCDTKILKKYLTGDPNYTGIDIRGNPDLKIDLEKIEELPFESESFDMVVCADVLEHIENIHLLLDEMCRVCKRFIIITLPNSLFGVSRYLFNKKYSDEINERKKYGKYLKYYGLPMNKPDDRHKWFFSYEDAIEFVIYRSKKYQFECKKIETNLMYEKFKFPKNILINIIKNISKNFAVRDIIFLLEKKSD